MLQDRHGQHLTTRSAAARDAYVQGADRLLSADAGTDAAFREAIAADDGFALAHIALARTLQIMGRGPASLPPLNSLPTQYRITVRGAQRWFAQCGFEATSVTWLFPGETVRVDAPGLDGGDPLVVEMRAGPLGRVDPPGIVGHLNYGCERA